MAAFRYVVAVIVLLVLAAAGFAQYGQAMAQADACSSDDVFIAFSADAQYKAACEAFMACIEWIDDFVPCMPHFYAERASMCEVDEDVCVAQARLQLALIGLRIGNGYVSHNQPDTYWIELAAKLADATMLEGATFNELTAWYEPIAENYGSHPMLDYSTGVLAELSGNTDLAAVNLDAAVNEDANNPVLYLTRGDFYAAQGQNELAALDYFLATALTGAPGLHEGLEAILTTRTTAYPFDYSTETYALYPVLETDFSPGGQEIADLSLEAPIETHLQQYGDLLLFIPGDFVAERKANPYRILLPLYVLSASNKNTYSWHGEDYDDGYGTRITLSEVDGIFKGSRSDFVFERTASRQFLLALEGHEDPRPNGFRCEGSPLTRLEGARFATPLLWWEPVQLYDAPGGTATEIESDSQTLIVMRGGPECLNGYTWWQVGIIISSVETDGWIQENIDQTRYLYDRIMYD